MSLKKVESAHIHFYIIISGPHEICLDTPGLVLLNPLLGIKGIMSNYEINFFLFNYFKSYWKCEINPVLLCQVLLENCGQFLWELTINSDLAITITVTSGKEGLGLLVSESSGTSREVLQEQPVRWTQGESRS